jgi:hypothetical protein
MGFCMFGYRNNGALMNKRNIVILSIIVLLLFTQSFASVLIESGSYGEIFPANNGDMHVLIRNDNSSYIYYSSEGVVKDIPLGVSDSSIYFETACSDGEEGVYVLYNYTENKTLYAQHFNSSGETIWDAPGIIVDTYTHFIAFATSALTPTDDFLVIYDNITPMVGQPYVDYDGLLKTISTEGIISSPVGESEYYHDLEIEMHYDQNTLYVKKWAASYITPIFGDTIMVGDTLNSGILEFDCDDHGYLFGIRLREGTHDTLELRRYDDQLHAIWETPIECYVGFSKRLSDPIYVRPEIMANTDGSVTIYPGEYSYSNQNVSRVDSSGEYIFSDLEIDVVLDAISIEDGSNLFLENHRQNDSTRAVQLVKVSVNGDILFSSILRYGNIWKGSIIENTDGSFATTLIYGDTIAIDKISSSGEVLVGVKDITTPADFTLSQNYPNPLNPTTMISYELPEAQNISLQIFDITGRLVETLYNGYKEAGHWDVTWNASDQSSGVYIYRLQVGDQSFSKKMVVLK